MGLKNFFIINKDENDKSKEVVPVEVSNTKKFPTESSTSLFSFGKQTEPTFTPINNSQVSSEHLAKATESYQNGFDSLNQAGYDFYEFYQSVASAGIDNPQVYSMAFSMGKSMDKTITKEKLIQQSEFYTSEINKNYSDNIAKGSAKKQELVNQKTNENQALISELDLMKQQLETMKFQIQDREAKLLAIGGKYEPRISEIDSKLAANELAKNNLTKSIEQVKNGIINNLK